VCSSDLRRDDETHPHGTANHRLQAAGCERGLIVFWIELAAAVLSALGVGLTALRHPWCWPVGLVSVVIYGAIFLDVRLYSDALLQALFGAMIIYGWVRWMHHLDDGGRVRIAALARGPATLHLLA